MKGIFWNIRGTGKKGRSQRIMELCKDNQVDFIGIQETKKTDFMNHYLESLVSGKNFEWKWLLANNTAGAF